VIAPITIKTKESEHIFNRKQVLSCHSRFKVGTTTSVISNGMSLSVHCFLKYPKLLAISNSCWRNTRLLNTYVLILKRRDTFDGHQPPILNATINKVTPSGGHPMVFNMTHVQLRTSLKLIG